MGFTSSAFHHDNSSLFCSKLPRGWRSLPFNRVFSCLSFCEIALWASTGRPNEKVLCAPLCFVLNTFSLLIAFFFFFFISSTSHDISMITKAFLRLWFSFRLLCWVFNLFFFFFSLHFFLSVCSCISEQTATKPRKLSVHLVCDLQRRQRTEMHTAGPNQCFKTQLFFLFFFFFPPHCLYDLFQISKQAARSIRLSAMMSSIQPAQYF